MTPAPLQAWPACDVHFAWIDRDIVTLDVGRDAYGLLIDAADHVRPGPSGRLLLDSADALAALGDSGLVIATPPTRPPPSPPSRPTHALPPGDGTVAALAPCLGAAVTAIAATARFHRRPLRKLLSDAAQARPPVRARPASLADAYGAFDAILPWIPGEGECLQRAFMLHRHLVKAGRPAQWVIGVRTWPFLAHAWVQVGPCVVGDSLERVRTFHPILAV